MPFIIVIFAEIHCAMSTTIKALIDGSVLLYYQTFYNFFTNFYYRKVFLVLSSTTVDFNIYIKQLNPNPNTNFKRFAAEFAEYYFLESYHQWSNKMRLRP
jgi:sensor histidine kinase YesM